MRGFRRRSTVDAALAWLDSQLGPLPAETIALRAAALRVLAADVVSRIDVPAFPRSMMDGYALCAADTLGASPYNRLSLQVVGESRPGCPPSVAVDRGQAVRIMTGAPLPPGADAVLPVEYLEVAGNSVLVLEQLPPGKHVAQVGEDVVRGTTVLARGRILRPQDLGVLASIGVAEVAVVGLPRVRVVVTGNELLPAGSLPAGYQIADANSPMLAALIARDGGITLNSGIVPDQPEAIRAALHDDADIVLVSGGSSVGQEDLAPVILARDGELAVHGVAMRPSSPAGMGRLGDRLVFLLPGNPVSCLCAYDFFAGRAIRVRGGRAATWPYRAVLRPLRRKLVSATGRVDYARVAIVDGGVEPLAIGGAAVLSSTTRADGFVVVPENSEGFPPGAEVTVYLYD